MAGQLVSPRANMITITSLEGVLRMMMPVPSRSLKAARPMCTSMVTSMAGLPNTLLAIILTTALLVVALRTMLLAPSLLRNGMQGDHSNFQVVPVVGGWRTTNQGTVPIALRATTLLLFGRVGHHVCATKTWKQAIHGTKCSQEPSIATAPQTTQVLLQRGNQDSLLKLMRHYRSSRDIFKTIVSPLR